ncbi:alpha/beta hydrolase [Deminuibacter soli]|uniref:Alpha/beta hydrolase n=1 Tax=Deminuibacter soli TaxID=2291815 RepID=A0A3E1NMI1_9BACT|nr:alpha/beta hydrolase [Deminuibacter soli]RFM29018.1 alpha/beta hydrolase [Deminuibacter soli]
MKRTLRLIPFLLFAAVSPASAQQWLPLYKDSIPNSIPSPDKEKMEIQHGIEITSNITRPGITLYQPAKPNGAAVIICPGGGYWIEATSHEGADVAKRFAAAGVTAIVLKYRIPNAETMRDKSIGALQDAQQALRLVRAHAAAWHIDAARVGIMGFSAGGHLASSAGTHFTKSFLPEADTAGLRPSFMILVYPVISFSNTIGHSGSREQLLGKAPDTAQVQYFSNELQVTAATPPTFLVHASDDDGVSPENSILFYQALLRNHVPAEMHLYQQGKHGFGMHLPNSKIDWMNDCLNWMATNQWTR